MGLLPKLRSENGEQEMKPIELKRRYPNSRDEDITDAFMRGYQSAKDELVRCKDCKKRGAFGEKGFCELYAQGVPDEHYCSYGERRETNE